MVQEVQTQWNRYQIPDRIEWIWVSERKVSDHTQVRERWTNWCKATTSLSIKNSTEYKSSSWTITDDDTVKYKTIWGKIYIPLAWTYLVRFALENGYAVAYSLKFRIYNGNREIYLYSTDMSDKEWHNIWLDLGRKNDISISLYMTWANPWEILTVTPKLQIIKL
jgi:hypothetical protein